MSNRIEILVSFIEGRGVYRVVNHNVVNSAGYGTVMITAVRKKIELHNVVCVSNLVQNLVSLSQVRKKHYEIIIDEEESQSGHGVLKFIHKQTDEAKMIGIETSNGIY